MKIRNEYKDLQYGATTCSECFLRVPQAAGLYCSCHAAQASKGNFQKTYYKPSEQVATPDCITMQCQSYLAPKGQVAYGVRGELAHGAGGKLVHLDNVSNPFWEEGVAYAQLAPLLA